MKKVLVYMFLFLVSCDSGLIFENNQKIKEAWGLDQKIIFKTLIKDTTSLVDVYVNIRHTSDYPFSNLWLFVNTEYSDTIIRDTLECLLAEKDGKWNGSGLGPIKFVSTKLKTQKFPKKGDYAFTIEQAMRYGDKSKLNFLPEIKDVGLRIEKSN